jgi:coenzyme Q-binding protein COQ10
MRTFQTDHLVHHSAERMFALVADVERYPEFVPLCGGIRVRDRRKVDVGEEIIADMTAQYRTFRETFTSRATLNERDGEILVEYVDGPFRHLENRWRFTPVNADSCNIHFYISYEFRNRALQMLAGAVFDRAFRKFVFAFEQRADRIYGVPGIAAAD